VQEQACRELRNLVAADDANKVKIAALGHPSPS
jgi:hypothetical protein